MRKKPIVAFLIALSVVASGCLNGNDGGEQDTNKAPTAQIESVTPSPAYAGQTVTFAGSGSDEDGFIVEYQWGSSLDGEISTDQQFSTNTLSVGEHTIYLKVIDDEGKWSSKDDLVLTILPENNAPVGNISVSEESVHVGEQVYFSAENISDPDGDELSYNWNFGDGNTSSDMGPQHNYSQAGTYNVFLTVSDGKSFNGISTFGLVISVVEEPTGFDFASPVPGTTFYHFDGARNATEFYEVNGTSVLFGNNIPIFSEGTYYGVGTTTFEPTIGVTLADNIYMTSWGTGSNGATAIIKCTNLVTMTNPSDYSCTDVGPPWVPNSNDPYLYVDLWTDAIMKFDMHALSGMTVEFSENEGSTWRGPTAITWPYNGQDQTIASSPYPCAQSVNCYDTTYVFCVNANYPAPLCSTSFDGGLTWSPEIVGAPSGCDSGGLTGHIIGSNNGNFYRGNPSCDGSGYSVYRSTNGGFDWTEHVLPTQETGTADTWNLVEVAVATDESDYLHASWIGLDNLPYYSYSQDEGDTWSDPIMIGPPGVNGTGFVTIAAGSEGRTAIGYIGTTNGGATWNGYMTVMTDSFNENPLLTTVVVNTPDDPLENSKQDCGYDRCGGFGDFIDMVIDQYGRPWFGLAHNPSGEIGIFGTFADGPSLRGEGVEALTPLPLGGPSTL